MGMDFYKKEATDGERSPWVGAGIGAGGGGLLAAALGYIYGHRGKWLAYDTLTGGLAGGAAGYAIESSNKNRIEEEAKEASKVSDPYAPALSDAKRWKSDKEFDAKKAERRESLKKHPKWYNTIAAAYTGELAPKGSYTDDFDKKMTKFWKSLHLGDSLANDWLVRYNPIHRALSAPAVVADLLTRGKYGEAGLEDSERTEKSKLLAAGLKRLEDGSVRAISADDNKDMRWNTTAELNAATNEGIKRVGHARELRKLKETAERKFPFVAKNPPLKAHELKQFGR